MQLQSNVKNAQSIDEQGFMIKVIKTILLTISMVFFIAIVDKFLPIALGYEDSEAMPFWAGMLYVLTIGLVGSIHVWFVVRLFPQQFR